MTRKALARRIAGPYLTSQQRGEAPAPRQPEGLRGFWPGALLLVGQRPQRVFSLLAPRTRPKFAAALLYEPQTWCTSSGSCGKRLRLKNGNPPSLPLPFTHGFDRFGIERPATEAIGTRVSRGPVSNGHGQGTAGIAFVALLDQLRARLR
jgi:hypothetical protein